MDNISNRRFRHLAWALICLSSSFLFTGCPQTRLYKIAFDQTCPRPSKHLDYRCEEIKVKLRIKAGGGIGFYQGEWINKLVIDISNKSDFVLAYTWKTVNLVLADSLRMTPTAASEPVQDTTADKYFLVNPNESTKIFLIFKGSEELESFSGSSCLMYDLGALTLPDGTIKCSLPKIYAFPTRVYYGSP